MSGPELLRSWFESGALIRPDPDHPTSVDLSQALAILNGVNLRPALQSTRVIEAIQPAEHYVFVLADGLGLNLIEALPEDSFLRSHVALELRSVFPSSTAPALTSLATGLWPAEHGVTSWFMRLPERGITATILPYLDRHGDHLSLTRLGIEPEYAFPVPSLLRKYQRPVRSFLPQRISNSVYTRYAVARTAVSGYASLAEAVDECLALIDGAPEPLYVHIYYPEVDAAEHGFGPWSAEVEDALAILDLEMARLGDGLSVRGGRLILSADHGQIEVPESARHVLEIGDPILDLLVAPPSGDPAVPMFHLRDGQSERFRSIFEDRMGEAFALLTVDEVEELCLFGPMPLSPTTRRRLGDFVGISRGDDILRYGPEESIAALIGFHGGLTRDEVRIPLIVA